MYNKTIKGKITEIYATQKKNSKKWGKEIGYTKEWLSYWMFSNGYEKLFNDRKDKGFETELSPSVNRIDDHKFYSKDNIELMTWQQNKNQMYLQVREGGNEKKVKAVVQYNLLGIKICEYRSCSSAERSTGIPRGSISACCRGKNKRAGGYLWSYLGQEINERCFEEYRKTGPKIL